MPAAFPEQATRQRALVPVSIGETYDFEFRPGTVGELRLEVRTGGGQLLLEAPVRVIR